MAAYNDPSIYPKEYYNYGPTANADMALKQMQAAKPLAVDKSYGLPYNPNQGGILGSIGAQLKQADPGITSAVAALEQIVSALEKHSYELEDTLGLSIPEPCSPPNDSNAYIPSLVVRIQNLGNKIDSANYKIHKSVNHLRS